MKNSILITFASIFISTSAFAQCGPYYGPCGPPPMRGGYPGMYREPGYRQPPMPYRVYPVQPRPDYLREFHEWGGRPYREIRPIPDRRWRPMSDSES